MSGPDPSRAAEVPVQKRTWMILGCIPEVVDKEDKFLPGTDMLLEFEDPPRTTMLTVSSRIAPDRVDLFPGDRRFPYVVDVHPSGRFLLHTTRGRFRDVYYLCDAHTGVATRLRDPDSAEKRVVAPRSIGLIADPRGHGHYMVAQLRTMSSEQHQHATLVYYSTETDAWAVKELGSSPHHQPWGSQGGVVIHDGNEGV